VKFLIMQLCPASYYKLPHITYSRGYLVSNPFNLCSSLTMRI